MIRTSFCLLDMKLFSSHEKCIDVLIKDTVDIKALCLLFVLKCYVNSVQNMTSLWIKIQLLIICARITDDTIARLFITRNLVLT